MKEPRPSAKPLYQQVKQHLVSRVLKKEWRPGECLPSEMRLAEEYNLSQGTIRKAIEEMASEGLVTRQAGKGTFVTSHGGDYQPFRFRRLHGDSEEKLTGYEEKYIHTKKVTADSRISRALQIPEGARGTEALRLRSIDTLPTVLERMFFSDESCPGIDKVLQQPSTPPIYFILEQDYGFLITRVSEKLRARIATDEEVELLHLTPGTPVLEIERIAYSLGREAVEWRITSGSTDHMHYRNEIG